MQSLTLNVYEAPNVTSAKTATMFVGMPGSFAVTTTGYPSVSNHVMPANPAPPISPDEGNGLHFTVTGLPAGLTASNLNPQGFASGHADHQGTPAAAGSTTSSGVYHCSERCRYTRLQQTLLLNIVGITGPAPASGTKCNGNYTGTFKGNITVSAGQNCSSTAAVSREASRCSAGTLPRPKPLSSGTSPSRARPGSRLAPAPGSRETS